MSNTFASLFRNSRLASYDRTLNQVYTTPLKHKKIGDWGLKRNLPTVIRTRYATIDALDTTEHQTPWESGNSQVLFLKRWKENFPGSKCPAPRSDKTIHNIAKMTPADFKRFLKHCASIAPEFQALLNRKELVPDQVFEYLEVTFADDPSESPVGPTYSDHTVESGYPIEGPNLRQKGDRRVRDFYVESATIDEEGKPRVVLTTTPLGSSSSHSFLLDFEATREPHPVLSMSTEDMFLIRKESIGRVKDDDQRVQANPDHEKLMSRITDLIKKRE
ncbi:hypothetical protein CU098_005499 [Rhizopus stolonifer]|uniref:Uncharacterized protein n=1 Tax=Rhizopus stolonifer TaxID=4846 RepID=A0A367IZJ7_RHIST|nr:hypothetical protein CU098_005499 [Rhizopus stolonifer]